MRNPFRRIFAGFILLLTALTGAFAAPETDLSGFDWELAGRIAVQAGGRVKPLDTFARELVAQITGKTRFRDQHPVETYFRWMSDGEEWSKQELIYLPKGDLRSRLGLNDHKGSRFSLVELQNASGLMDVAMEAQKRQEAGEKLTFTQSKANDLINRMQILSTVFSHETPLYVPVNGGDPQSTWLSMSQAMMMLGDSLLAASMEPSSGDTLPVLGLSFAALYNSIRDHRADMFNAAASVFVSTQSDIFALRPTLLSRLRWEAIYTRLHPFLWAKIALGGAFLLFAFSLHRRLSRIQPAALAAMAAGFVLYTAGLAIRAYLAGRAPWSNMYESLVAIGWALVLLTAIFELMRRDRMFGMIGGALGTIVLALAEFASLDRGINPLVPALQSYWLNYHVIITLAGYAAFAIAMGLGHAVLISGVRSKGEVTPGLANLTKANLRVIQIGSLLLITGILLGAVWANVSWGRFWGWDPKETWALICWFVYIVLLHGRSAGWLAWRGLAAASVGAFPIVIMTYYGVNYYLSGLHSYGAGSSPGIPWQVYAYLGIEALFLAWVLVRLRGAIPRRPGKAAQTGGVSAQTTEIPS